MEQARQRSAGQVVADEDPARSQHPRDLGDGALPVDDVMQHQAADDGVEGIVGKRHRGGVGRFHRCVREPTQPRGGGLRHVRVDIYCRPSKFGSCRKKLLRNGSTPDADFQHVAAQPLGTELTGDR